MANPIGWINIPVLDKERALSFYNEVFDWAISFGIVGKVDMAPFPSESEEAGAPGCLMYDPTALEPSKHLGPLVYFSTDDVAVAAEKAERAGGRIVELKRPIAPGYGYMSVVTDTEGNRIAFHSGN